MVTASEAREPDADPASSKCLLNSVLAVDTPFRQSTKRFTTPKETHRRPCWTERPDQPRDYQRCETPFTTELDEPYRGSEQRCRNSPVHRNDFGSVESIACVCSPE